MSHKLDSDNLRRAFLSALGVSWALMLIIKLLSLGGLLLVIAPVIVMAMYLRFFLNADNKESYREQFADSLYSLGFLLTLTALMITFMPFFLHGNTITMEDTLGNFGVALVTTLFGLTARIYLTSFTLDLEQMQKQAVCNLENDVRLFKEEMGSSIKVMHEFNAELEKTTRKTVEDFGASLAGAGAKITNLVENTMTDAFNPLAKTFEDLARDVAGATQGFGTNLNSSFTHCVDSVHAITLEPDFLKNVLKPVVENFDRAGHDIDQSLRSVATSLEGSSGELDSAMNNFSSSVGALNMNLLSSLKKLVADFEELTVDPDVFNRMLETAFMEFKNAVDGVAEQTRGHGTALEQSAESITRALPAYDKVAENIQYILELDTQLAEPVRQFAALSGRIETLAHNLTALERQTQEYVTSVGASVDIHRLKSHDMEHDHREIREVRAKLEAEYEKTIESIKHLGDTFTGIAQFVTHKLKREGA